jgi:hypothetical protein
MRIIEVDREGTIVKEVKLTTECTKPHRQMRCAREIANGNYIVGQYDDGVYAMGLTGDATKYEILR